jgi:hypothetical protein
MGKYKQTDRNLVFTKEEMDETKRGIVSISEDRLQYLLQLMNTF